MLRFSVALFSSLLLLSACGGGGGDGLTGGGSDGGGSGGGGSGGGGTGGGTTGITILGGASSYDDNYPIINSALAVLDANGAPINYLDGGDFAIFNGNATSPDPESHWDAQKLPYPAQVAGTIVLMIDRSDSMVPHFAELKAAATNFVTEAAAFGLTVEVHAFDTTTIDLGTVAGGASATTVNNAINALPAGAPTTYFYEMVKAMCKNINERAGLARNHVYFTHPNGIPTAHVITLVVMSDGVNNSGQSSSSEVNTEKDKRFNIFVTAIGTPDETGLKTISEVYTAVPTGGTYTDAANNTLTKIKNFYNALYVVDNRPNVLEGSSKNYSIKVVNHDEAALTITYDPDDAGFKALPDIPPYCCKVRITPNVSPGALPVGTAVQFKAVQLWTNDQPTDFHWTLSGSALNMSVNTDTSIATVTASGATTGTLNVSSASTSWTNAPIALTAP